MPMKNPTMTKFSIAAALFSLTACGDPDAELCGDGVDNDGDALIDCDDPGDCSAEPTCTDVDGDRYSAAEDCDDSDPAVFPGATELCDGVDNDCDGTTDQDALDAFTWYADADGDGFGDASNATTACDAPGGFTFDATDCDDTDAAICPGAAEVCDSVDNDCDALVDDDDPDVTGTAIWYLDYDGDGYGASSAYDTTACDQPSGYEGNGDDCDDLEPGVYPDAVETCDEVDQDCDGTVDEETDCYDDDGDGFAEVEGDCDDESASDFPGAVEDHLGIAMTCIGPGAFTMGSPEDEVARNDDESQHEVTLTRAFHIGVYEVTQAQYYQFTGETPSFYSSSTLQPVEQVTWFDAAAFANAVSVDAGFTEDELCYACDSTSCALAAAWEAFDDGVYECPAYRLLTEAEWEYAARAGTSSAFSNGGNLSPGDDEYCDGVLQLDSGLYLSDIAVYCGVSATSHQEVGTKDANPWGLYDMHGNVYEWCHDACEDSDYSGDQIDPWGSSSEARRMARGGGWASIPRNLRSANRACTTSDGETKIHYRGLRLARTAE